MPTPLQTVIVTGGAQGIGKGMVHDLLRRNWAVMMVDRDAEAGAETLAEYADIGSLRFTRADVSAEAAVEQAVAATIQAFGRLDALINNAGIADPGHLPLEDTSLDAWNRVLAVNLTGAFLCAKHAAPHLRRARGAIVNIASTRAVQSEPNTFAYSASKGGLVALTHALAVSLGPAIRVNGISPGWIAVDDLKKQALRTAPALSDRDHAQHPCGRVGQAGDIAAMAAFLLSAEAGFITGQNFIVDGGMTRKMIYAE
jgi:NAD(P)-dependent dehydrogenase (short-subunit alcohol dehydrogenase family)